MELEPWFREDLARTPAASPVSIDMPDAYQQESAGAPGVLGVAHGVVLSARGSVDG